MIKIRWGSIWREIALNARTIGIGGYVLLGIMFALLAAATLPAYFGWSSAGETGVPPSGYLAMALGILFSSIIGAGLMTLLFYSSRSGYDEPAKIIPSGRDESQRS
ncbi:hypothetical protein ACFKHW_38895 (plasmid) [Bradyrhizobium lupini]|uniref:hypothetical protein n=1 Tax=Rhizobium lupini TaxID=136996 RepID=UPI00366D8A58